MSSFEESTPVVLSGSCQVNRNNTGQPPALDLTYPFRKALWIEEIRFQIYKDQEGSVITRPQLGANIAMTMALGRHYIARYPVPIWLLGTVQDRTMEGVSLATDVTQDVSQYRWRLPAPLYLEPGQTLLPIFQRGIPAGLPDDGMTNAFTVWVTYAGRVASPNAPRPKTIQVPFVSPFITDTSATYQETTENDLANPFDKPLRVQRLTGRVYTQTAGSSADEAQALTPTAAGLASVLTVMMEDSWGGKMVNNPTGPSDVWDILRGAWTVDTMLPAKSQYRVRATNLNTAAFQYLHVGLIATREEAL